MSEITRNALVEDADCDIILWLRDHDAPEYILSAERIREIQEWGGSLSIYNPIGLKRRIGKILKEDGYTKIPNVSPPHWVKNNWVPRNPVSSEIPSNQKKNILIRIVDRVRSIL